MAISRRAFLGSLTGLAVASGTGYTASQLMVSNAEGAAGALPPLPYTPDSFFRSTVIGAPVDTAATAEFRRFMGTHPDQKDVWFPKINGTVPSNQWGTSFYLGKAEDPIWKLAGGVSTDTKILATQGFHMADAVADRFPGGSQDRPGMVNDMVFGYTAHFADAVPNKATRTIQVSASAVFWHDSNGLDKRNTRSDSTRNFSSRGRIPDAMVIRGDLVQAAALNGTSLGHVLHMFFVETSTAAGVCHPMVGAENGKYGWGAEGVRIAVDPNINLAARGFTGGALALAKTLQQHGCYLGDNSGSASQLKGEQATTTYAPYAGTNITPTCLSRLRWSDFIVLPKGWQGGRTPPVTTVPPSTSTPPTTQDPTTSSAPTSSSAPTTTTQAPPTTSAAPPSTTAGCLDD